MSLKTRLDRLSMARAEYCAIQVWLYDLDSDTATGPDGERMTHAEADRCAATSGLVTDLRVNREI